MALQKPVALDNGVIAQFHAVKSIVQDFSTNPPTTNVTLSSFVDAASAAKGFDKAVNANDFTFDPVPDKVEPLDFAIQQIKLRDEWADAVDAPDPVLTAEIAADASAP